MLFQGRSHTVKQDPTNRHGWDYLGNGRNLKNRSLAQQGSIVLRKQHSVLGEKQNQIHFRLNDLTSEINIPIEFVLYLYPAYSQK